MARGLRVAAVGTAVAASAVLVTAAVASAGPSDDDDGSRTMRFDVEFSSPNYTDFAEPGFSDPDAIVFHDTLLRDGEPVGARGRELRPRRRRGDRQLHRSGDPRRSGDDHVRLRERPAAGEDPGHHRRYRPISGRPQVRAPWSSTVTGPEP